MERRFSEEVLTGHSWTRSEIAAYFRRRELKGEKGWRIVEASCKFSREHPNYHCPQDYYTISATFTKVAE